MEFKSLPETIRFMEQQLVTNFYNGRSAVIRKGVLKVLASVLGAALYMLHLVAKRMWKNRFVHSCDIDALDGFGAEYAVPHKPPVYATGYVSVALSSGTASLPSGTLLLDEVTKKEYKTVNDVALSVGSNNVRVMASEPGAESNVYSGTELVFIDSVPSNVGDSAEVIDDGIVGGKSVDVVISGNVEQWGESAEDYRARLLNRIQNPPHGGSANDYKQWAERFNFVSKAFVFAHNPNINSVVVACANIAEGSTPAITDDQVEEVNNYINADERRPVTADVLVMSVSPVKMVINATCKPFNDDVKKSVTDALKSVLQNMGPESEMNFSDARVYVLANSKATDFSISSVQKYNGNTPTTVNKFEFVLDVTDANDPIAEMIDFSAGMSSVSLTSAGE